MKYRWDKKYLYWGVTAFLVILAGLLCVSVLFRSNDITGTLGTIINIIKPVLYGLVFAFLLNPIARFLEKMFARVFKKPIGASPKPVRWQKAGRAVAITLACLIFLAIIAGLLWMVIPQLITSISGIFANFEKYYKGLQDWLNGLLRNNPDFAGSISGAIEKGFTFVENWIDTSLLPQAQNLLSGVASGAISTVIVLKDLIIGFIIAVYLLFSKEKFIGQTKKMLYSMVKKNRANHIIETCQYANRMFSGFITGRILDGFIIGMLCFIAMLIFQMPFPVLISVIIGVTNIIPFFGPFIGAIPSALLILLVNPVQCLYFVLMILVLQQLDGNVIGPKIQGDVTGLSGFWVIFSITIFGGLFGIVGILVSVPLFAVIYSLIRQRMERSLKKRKMSLDTAVYMDTGCIYQSDPVEEVDDPHYPQPEVVDPEERAAAEAAAKATSRSRQRVSGWINRMRQRRQEEKREEPEDGGDKPGKS